VLPYFRLLFRMQSFFSVSEGTVPSTTSWLSLYASWRKIRLFTSRSPVREPSCRSYRMTFCFQDVAAPWSLGSLCHGSLPISPDFSFRTSIP
jgi:hypothetical protein